MPKTKLKKAKDNAWKQFSLYIRTRDSLKTTGGLASCVCVTCGKTLPRLGMGCIQAGHFIGGRTNAVLFSEEGVHGQCGACNNGVYARNNQTAIKYFLFMEQEYGREFVDKLMAESKITIKYKPWELDEIADRYAQLTAKLERDNV